MADDNFHKLALSESFERVAKVAKEREAFNEQMAMREGLEAAIRAAELALFVIQKQGIMPNSSWQRGFDKDMQTAAAALEARGLEIREKNDG